MGEEGVPVSAIVLSSQFETALHAFRPGTFSNGLSPGLVELASGGRMSGANLSTDVPDTILVEWVSKVGVVGGVHVEQFAITADNTGGALVAGFTTGPVVAGFWTFSSTRTIQVVPSGGYFNTVHMIYFPVPYNGQEIIGWNSWYETKSDGNYTWTRDRECYVNPFEMYTSQITITDSPGAPQYTQADLDAQADGTVLATLGFSGSRLW